MKILMVTPYAPHRDGIAAYAVQSVAALRREGNDVEVLSPGPSAAHHHLDLASPRGALALAKRVRSYDKVVVQFHPDVFYRVPARPSQLLATHLALTAAFTAAHRVEVVLHEIDYRWGRGSSAAAMAARRLWRSVDTIVVHTDTEHADVIAAFRVPAERVVVTDHGAHFVRRTTHDRASARRSLDLPDDARCLLSIGFIQQHKGFDRAVRAFASAGLVGAGCRLDIVGSTRLDDPAVAGYVAALEDLVAATPGVELHEGYLSDELFDRWIVASDAVVLPYRSIWSSGVLERAALYARPVIVTDVGGLGQQAARSGADVTLVNDDAGLTAAMQAAAGERAALRAPSNAPWPDGDRAAVQAAVAERAAARRPGGLLPASSADVDGGAPADPRRGQNAVERSATLRRLPPLALPSPASTRFSARLVKGVVRRLTGWEIDPLVWQVNAVREATIAALERDRQV